MEHLTVIGSAERAEYLKGRAEHAARELMPRGQVADREDLAGDILLWALKRDERAKLEGATEAPRYTKLCLRYAGIDSLRRARRTHRYFDAPKLISIERIQRLDEMDVTLSDFQMEVLEAISHEQTPEVNVLAGEAIRLEIRRRRRAGRAVPAL